MAPMLFYPRQISQGSSARVMTSSSRLPRLTEHNLGRFFLFFYFIKPQKVPTLIIILDPKKATDPDTIPVVVLINPELY